MPLQPGYLWPEPKCFLSGSVLHVDQATWKQSLSFLPLPADSKWMVAVYVGGTLVHGEEPNLFAGVNDATAYDDEMDITQTSMSVDLASYGVDESHPLVPVVRVRQLAAAKNTTGWWWSDKDWQRGAVPLTTYIDSKAGVKTPPSDEWIPLTRCFFDEGAEEGVHWTHGVGDNWDPTFPLGAESGSVSMQFQLQNPYCTIDGIQVWLPPELWDGTPPTSVTVRLWKGPTTTAGFNVVVTHTDTPLPGWTNIYFDDPYPAETQFIPDPTPTPDDPYSLTGNPSHDGWYTVGIQTMDGVYYDAGADAAYKAILPEHVKVYGADNHPAGTWAINRGEDAAHKVPEWAPRTNASNQILVGPILTYTPTYPLLKAGWLPQIYRRAVAVPSG